MGPVAIAQRKLAREYPYRPAVDAALVGITAIGILEQVDCDVLVVRQP